MQGFSQTGKIDSAYCYNGRMKSSSIAAYEKYYVDMHLERAGLFQAVQQKYGGATVLYPGCFVHITPSFFFPHVVYVDRMAEAETFFAAEPELVEFIRQNKRYKRPAYTRFIRQDFLQPLPVPDDSYDLLIALYAGGITQACKRYVRPGGLILTNNHHDDAGQAAADSELTLVAAIICNGETYTVEENGLEDYFVPRDLPGRAKRYLQPSGSRVEYTRTAEAYIFKKTIRA